MRQNGVRRNSDEFRLRAATPKTKGYTAYDAGKTLSARPRSKAETCFGLEIQAAPLPTPITVPGAKTCKMLFSQLSAEKQNSGHDVSGEGRRGCRGS